MHEVLVNCLGGLSLPRKSVVRLTDRPDMTLDFYRGRKTTTITTDQMLHYVVSDMGLHCLCMSFYRGPGKNGLKICFKFVFFYFYFQNPCMAI